MNMSSMRVVRWKPPKMLIDAMNTDAAARACEDDKARNA